MVDSRLVNYVKAELSKGVSLEQIKQNLLPQGWSEEEINEAINSAKQGGTPTPQSSPQKEPNKSSKLWIIIGVIVILIIGASAFFIFSGKPANTQTSPGGLNVSQTPSESPNVSPEASTNIVDCGADIDCFITASQNCNPAKVMYTTTINLMGQITSTTYLELKGMQGDKCILYMQTKNSTAKFTDEMVQKMLAGGATQEQIKQQEQMINENLKKTEGKYQTCKFDINDLTDMLKRWKSGSYSSEDFKNAECTGNYQLATSGA